MQLVFQGLHIEYQFTNILGQQIFPPIGFVALSNKISTFHGVERENFLFLSLGAAKGANLSPDSRVLCKVGTATLKKELQNNCPRILLVSLTFQIVFPLSYMACVGQNIGGVYIHFYVKNPVLILKSAKTPISFDWTEGGAWFCKMSGGIRKRDSKWDSKEESRFSVENERKFNDKRSPRWPSEATGNNNGHRMESIPVNRGGYDKGNYDRTLSPGPDDLRKHHHNSPKNYWNRSHRSRSRSRSPVRGYRRESEVYDRNRNRSSGAPSQICKDYAIGRCRRANHCPFLHQGNENYEDSWENRDHRKVGSSKYSILPDSRDYPNPSRTGRSAEFCDEFDKGNSRREEREKDIRNTRDASFEQGNEREPRRIEIPSNERESRRNEIPGNERDSCRIEIPGNERESRRIEIPGNERDSHRNEISGYEREPRRTEIPCKFFAAGNCRKGKYCRFSHNDNNMRRSPDRRSRDDYRRMQGHNSGRENFSNDNTGRSNPELHNNSSYSSKGEPAVNHMDIENDIKETQITKTEIFNDPRDTHNWIDDVAMSPGLNFGVESPENVVKEDRGHVIQNTLANTPGSLIDLNSSANAMPSFQQGNQGELNHVQNSRTDIISNLNMSQVNAPTQSVVSSVQLTQLTNLLPQLYATLNSQNIPDVPPLEKSEVQPNKVNEAQKQYDPISDSNDLEKHASISIPKKSSPNLLGPKSITEGNSEVTPKKIPSNSTVHHEVRKNEKVVEEKVNGLVDIIDDDNKAEDGKKSKEVKGMRAFKFTLVEFLKELLKPAWKEGQINKEDYKNIVKKAVDKVTGTMQGPSIPQTQEKIDQYLSSSKPKLMKLVQFTEMSSFSLVISSFNQKYTYYVLCVSISSEDYGKSLSLSVWLQAYVEKFQKGGKEA
ncbi:hypothetical protein ACFE04_014852 [Oxalis oulophora]